MVKIIFLILILSKFAFDISLKILSARQVGKPLPSSVEGIYDREEYERFRSYNAKTDRLSIVSSVVLLIFSAVIYLTDIISAIYYFLPGGEIAKAILFLLIMGCVETVITLPISYIGSFKIEAEFGFNKTTGRTFVADTIKNLLLSTVLNFIIFLIIYGAYSLFGDYFGLIALAGIGVLVFAISSLYTVFSKLFNKFTSLEEGELREELTGMFKDAGYRLRDIYVMDASKRTTKANAYCGGIGKFKQIVLYDNLVNNYTPDEITAVFAHELAHFKHKDTAKATLFNLINFIPLVVVMTLLMVVPEISESYGFTSPSILFAYYVGFGNAMSILMSLISCPLAAISRAYERRADRFACERGYGDALASALRKLHKDSLDDMNPHPTVVKLTYDHPPLYERLDLIEKSEKRG